MSFTITLGDFTAPKVIALLRYHLHEMQGNSPEGTSYALDLSGLQSPDISFYTLWEEDSLLGCGALKALSADHGEIKSMRTVSGHQRRGVAKSLLTHIIEEAKRRDYNKLSLETGTGPDFEAANGLYQSYGFQLGEIFSDYRPSDFNLFYHLSL